MVGNCKWCLPVVIDPDVDDNDDSDVVVIQSKIYNHNTARASLPLGVWKRMDSSRVCNRQTSVRNAVFSSATLIMFILWLEV